MSLSRLQLVSRAPQELSEVTLFLMQVVPVLGDDNMEEGFEPRQSAGQLGQCSCLLLLHLAALQTGGKFLENR